MITSTQSIIVSFTTRNATTGAASAADSLPIGTLTVNGVDDAAIVTVALVSGNNYTASVVLPILNIGDRVAIRIAATVATISDVAYIWDDWCDVTTNSRATQESVTAIPTTPLLATDPRIDAIATGAQVGVPAAVLTFDAGATAYGVAKTSDLPPAPDNAGIGQLLAVKPDYKQVVNAGGATLASNGFEAADRTKLDGVKSQTDRFADVEADALAPVPAGNSSQTTLYVYCYDKNGAVEADIPVYIRMRSSTLPGAAYSASTITVTSGVDGLASALVPRGASVEYAAKRQGGQWVEFAGADADTLAMPAMLGRL